MLPGLRFSTDFRSAINLQDVPQVDRTRLISNIQYKLRPGSLLVIQGEAGSGKSVLMQQLASHFEQPCALLDLGKISSNPSVFLKLLTEAFCSLWPVLSKKIKKSRTYTPKGKSTDPVAFFLSQLDSLLDEIYMNAPGPAVLMIDSWERVASSSVHNLLLNTLVRKLPDFLTLILAGRWFPPQIETSHLAISGRHLQISDNELLFDKMEIKRLLKAKLKGQMSQDMVEKIQAFTNGWPAAVTFLANNPELLKDKKGILSNNSKPLFSFIMQHLITALPKDMKKLMVYCAISQPFDNDLPKAVFPENLSQLFYSRTSSIPLLNKTNEGYYKLPDILSSLLKSKASTLISVSELKKLYLNLAIHMENSQPDRAFFFYLKAGHETFAWKLLKKHFNTFIRRGQSDLIISMIQAFDKKFMKKNPQAYSLLGEAFIMAGKIDQAIDAMKEALSRLPKLGKTWKKTGCRLAEAYLLKDRYQEAAELCRQILRLTPPLSYHNLETSIYLAIAYNQLGLREEKRYWKKIESIANSRLIPLKPEQRCYLLAPKAGFYHIDRGEFKKAEEIIDYCLKVFKDRDPMNRLAWTLMFKGVIKLETGKEEQATVWFRQAVHKAKSTNRSIYCLSSSLLAFGLAYTGNVENLPFWLNEAKKNLKFDTSIWSECLSTLAYLLSHKDMPAEKYRERLRKVMALACARQNAFLSYYTALTGMNLTKEIDDYAFIEELIKDACKVSEKQNIQHRRMGLFFFKWHLKFLQKSDELEKLDKKLCEAIETCQKLGWGFLLTKPDSKIPSPILGYCLEKGICPDFILSLWPAWEHAHILAPFDHFATAPMKTRLAMVEFWKRHGIKTTIPLIKKLKKEVKSQEEKACIDRAICQLQELPPDPLDFRTLGTFKVARPYLQITGWKRKKARDLLKFLLIHHGQPVPVSQLIETFWPDMDYKSAKANLWSSMSALRATLEPELPPKARSSYLLVEDENYLLRLPEQSTIDYKKFESLFRRGLELKKTDQERCVALLEKARTIYKGPFLPEDLYKDWTTSLRERLSLLFQELLRTLAQIYLDRRQLAECVVLANELIEQDPWDEQAYLLSMQAFVLKGQDLRALQVYEKCKKVLNDELGLTPSQDLENFKRLILKRRSSKILFKP